jgi:hypothetical protein
MIGSGTLSSSRTSLVALDPLLRSLAIIVSFNRAPTGAMLGAFT